MRVTEFYKECYRATDPWKQMPRRMLRHKALKEAARVAFGFSGITDEDEARDIKPANAHTVSRIVEKPDFTSEETERFKQQTGTQSDPAPAPAAPVAPAMPSKPESKDKTAARKQDSPQNRLFSALTQERINQSAFLEDLKVIKFADVPSDAEVVHELSDETCEAILERGLSQIIEDIADARRWEGIKK